MDALSTAQLWGWIGGILGSLMGIAGGIAGTYFTIKNTASPRERAFAVRASVVCWVLALAFVAGMVFIPGWFRHLLWIPYIVLMVWGINALNQALARIRMEESSKGP